MSRRIRALSTLIGMALAAAAVAGGGAADTAPVHYEAVPVIHVAYAQDCTFEITVDGGIAIDASPSPGTMIPPGTYLVSVRFLPDTMLDLTKCSQPMFQLTGPGVSYSTSLSAGAAVPSATVTLPPSSTYVAVDGNYPTTTQRFFSTAASGSNSSLTLAYAGTPSGTSTGKPQSDLVGSGIVPFRGALDATVAAAGKVTVAAAGKPVVSVKAGRYDIVARDTTSRGGLFVQKLTRPARAITGVAFTGKRTVKVSLTVGKWMFFSTSGKATPFVVTA